MRSLRLCTHRPCIISTSEVDIFPLLSLPKPALQAVVDAVRGESRSGRYARALDGCSGALDGLRGTCRQLKAEANARTRQVRIAAAAQQSRN